MKYLGIDYGSKKTGVAISDDGGEFAFPYSVIATKNIRSELPNIIDSGNVGAIIIGKSVDHTGAENAIMENARELADYITNDLQIPVHFQDESFSSHTAGKWSGFDGLAGRRQANTRGRDKGKKVFDDSAAAVILQRYLDGK